MTAWIKRYQLGLTFLSTLVVGLALVSVAAFLISAFCGLLTTGTLMIAAGHWVTYLKTQGVRQ